MIALSKFYRKQYLKYINVFLMPGATTKSVQKILELNVILELIHSSSQSLYFLVLSINKANLDLN